MHDLDGEFDLRGSQYIPLVRQRLRWRLECPQTADWGSFEATLQRLECLEHLPLKLVNVRLKGEDKEDMN